MNDYIFNMFYGRHHSQEYVLDKDKSVSAYKGYMLNRLLKMFHYEGLPKTIPQEMLEYYLMINGSCVVSKVNDKLYAFIGTFGGEPDPYYRPTRYIVANPGLRFDHDYPLFDTDGELSSELVFIKNDKLWMGLNPLISRYATLMAENTLTLRTADIMLRVIALITAPDDKSKVAADAYLKAIEDGKLASVAENRFLDGIKMQNPPTSNGSYLTQFIELQQYYKGSFFNEIGLSASFNMKREAIGEGEATLNEDTLTPLVDIMLECRKEGVSRLNEIFETNVTVDFDSAWLENVKERRIQLDMAEAEVSQLTDEDKKGEEDAGGNQFSNTADKYQNSEDTGSSRADSEPNESGESVDSGGGEEDEESVEKSAECGDDDPLDNGSAASAVNNTSIVVNVEGDGEQDKEDEKEEDDDREEE